MTESSKIISEIADKVHITLTKNTKGYQWEISVYGSNVDETVTTIYTANSKMKLNYGDAQA